MITLQELREEMARSGYSLTKRGARLWWTKGLLPRPQRRYLGQGKGSQTYWTNRRVVDQAKAAYEMLAQHSRTHTALVGLWLLGFPIEFSALRAAWEKLCDARIRQFSSAENIVPSLSRQMLQSGSPEDVRNAATDLLAVFLEKLFGGREQSGFYGLSELWGLVAPYLQNSLRAPAMSDACFRWLGRRIEKWLSFPSQQLIISSATNHEYVRARRILLILLGSFGRLQRRAAADDQFQSVKLFEARQCLIIVFGRPLVPIIMTLHREKFGPRIVRKILQHTRSMKSFNLP